MPSFAALHKESMHTMRVILMRFRRTFFFFFFNDTATTEIYTLSLHDALPICHQDRPQPGQGSLSHGVSYVSTLFTQCTEVDRKSTRLNSSHLVISYAVFCLKKKKSQSKLFAICD